MVDFAMMQRAAPFFYYGGLLNIRDTSGVHNAIFHPILLNYLLPYSHFINISVPFTTVFCIRILEYFKSQCLTHSNTTNAIFTGGTGELESLLYTLQCLLTSLCFLL